MDTMKCCVVLQKHYYAPNGHQIYYDKYFNGYSCIICGKIYNNKKQEARSTGGVNIMNKFPRFPQHIELVITERDVMKGDTGSSSYCPIALSAKRFIEYPDGGDVSAMPLELKIYGIDIDEQVLVYSSDEYVDFVDTFDRRRNSCQRMIFRWLFL